jgi:hypothetical protein
MRDLLAFVIQTPLKVFQSPAQMAGNCAFVQGENSSDFPIPQPAEKAQ